MRVSLGLAFLVMASAACSGKDPYKPGTPLGSFHVAATRTKNTCGEQNVPADPWKFDVRLSRDPGKLYWVQGGQPVSGALDKNAHASLLSKSSATIHPADPKNGLGACSISRSDTLDATLEETPVPLADGGTANDVNRFTGSLTYHFAPDEASDCADVVLSGGFADLPCEISFSLVGVRDPKKK